MATCRPLDDLREFSDDDAGAVTDRLARAESFHANYGFEDGLKYWDFSGFGSFGTTTDAHHGARALRYTPATSGSHHHQTQRLTTLTGVSIKPRASLKRTTTSRVSGYVYLRVYTRAQSYAPLAADDECGKYPTDRDQNELAGAPSLYVMTAELIHQPRTSYSSVEGSSWSVTHERDKGVDVQLRIHSSVRLSGTSSSFVEIKVDNARVWG